MNEIQKKLSADPGAMVLGIISIVIILTGCCCGILAIPALIMSIIGWVWAANSKKSYQENPEQFFPRSFSNVKTALILNMIATIIIGVLLTIGLIINGFSLFNPETYIEQWENREFDRMNDDMDTGSEESTYEIDEWEYEETTSDTIDYQEELETIEAGDTINN